MDTVMEEEAGASRGQDCGRAVGSPAGGPEPSHGIPVGG